MAPHDDNPDADAPPTAEPAFPEVSRRDFLKTVGVAGAAGSVVVPGAGLSAQTPPAAARQGAPTPPVDRPYMRIRQEVAENLVKRGIVGYADNLRVQPGETIRFMVSSEVPRYRADIVRLIHGDANPSGPGIKEVALETPANGEYAGRRQELPLGSYAFVPDHPSLRLTGSFSFTAWIAPTSQRGAAPDGFVGVEGVLTKWAGARGGYGIFIDEEGRLALWITDASGRTEKLTSRQRPPAVGAGHSGHEQPAAGSDHGVVLRRRHLRRRVGPRRDPPGSAEHLHVRSDAGRHRAVGDHSDAGNQRLAAADRRRLGAAGPRRTRTSTARSTTRGSTATCSAARRSQDIKQGQPGPPTARGLGLRGRHRVGTDHRHRPGTAARANREPADARRDRPQLGLVRDGLQAARGEQYGAIYFHDDDIEDARWEVGFEFRRARHAEAASTRPGCATARARTTCRSSSARRRGGRRRRGLRC